jgi:Protein of unknown function (DUF3987)/Bifunctional DNA primase/polymerase, N-terminal
MRSFTTIDDSGPPAPLEAALEYAAFGYGVFPCDANKDPIWVAGVFEHGHQNATLDPALITTTWANAKYKAAEIGLSPPRGGLIVDVDVAKGKNGRDDFIRLFGCAPEDMATAVAATPSAGWHVYLSFDPSLDLVQRPITPSIDIKIGGKGYVLAPYPGNGRPWVRPLFSTPLMAAPQWLIDALRRAPEPEPSEAKPFDGEASARASLALGKACEALAAAAPGTRDATIAKAVYRIGRLAGAGELEPEDAKARLIAANAANPHYEARCARRDRDKIKRQFDKGFANPAEPGPVDDRHADEDDFGGGDSAAGGQPSQPSQPSRSPRPPSSPPSQPWEPLDLAFFGADAPPPRLSDDALPAEGWSDVIGAAAEAAMAPADYTALNAIVGAAGVIGNAVVVQATSDWMEPAVLWGMPVGLPGSRKTAALKAPKAGLIAINISLEERWEEECRRLDVQDDIALAAYEEEKAKKGKDKDKKLSKKPKEHKRPPYRLLIYDDVTYERVTERMRGQSARRHPHAR